MRLCPRLLVLAPAVLVVACSTVVTTTPTTSSVVETTTRAGTAEGPEPTDGPAATSEPTTATTQSSSSTAQSTAAQEPTDAGRPIPIRIRFDRRVDDAATAGFAALAEAILTDERGWQRAGFVFTFSETEYDYTLVLAEGAEVDQLCLPYDTGGRFSCQIGPVVALNADRWRVGVDTWPASLDDYRTMLVNHEVGHLIGQHHPAVRCPGEGAPSPVMAQQSSGVGACTANPWPLDWEIECASLGLEPLAPPYENDIQLTCGPDGPLG